MTRARRPEGVPGLTDRQADVLRGWIIGQPHKIIARRLNLSVRTVKTHVAMGYKALGVHNRAQLVAYVAARAGIDIAARFDELRRAA